MGLLAYWRRRRGTRLYQSIAEHWLERDSTLPDDILPSTGGGADPDSLSPESLRARSRARRLRKPRADDHESLEVRMPTRHVLVLVSTIGILLLVVAILSTVLAMQSC